MQREALASPPEVAQFYGVPVKTLYQWRYEGRGPEAVKIGRHLRYRWSDVEGWLKDQRDGGRS